MYTEQKGYSFVDFYTKVAGSFTGTRRMQAALADPRPTNALEAAGVREPVAVAGVVRATVVEKPHDVVLCRARNALDALAADPAADPAAGLLPATRQHSRDAPPHLGVDIAREVRLGSTRAPTTWPCPTSMCRCGPSPTPAGIAAAG